MSKKRSKKAVSRRAPPGSSPGCLGDETAAVTAHLSAAIYSSEAVVWRDLTINTLSEIKPTGDKRWVHINGILDRTTLDAVGAAFGVHALILEDILTGGQRAKVEEYDDNLFVVVWKVQEHDPLEFGQVSIVIGKNFVLSFQEGDQDDFEPIRERLRRGGRIRNFGSDYLAYALVDAVVDHYFPVIEKLADQIEDLEEVATETTRRCFLDDVQRIRRNLLALRKHLWPFREALARLLRRENPLIDRETITYLRDTADHVAQVLDLTETQRELATSVVDLHLTAQGQRMNEIMRTLTVIATVFMPMSFLAGLYGMNFDSSSPWNLPELRWQFGYPFALSLMITVGVSLLFYLKRRGFLN